MAVVDKDGNVVENPDLSKGRIVTEIVIRDDAEPLSDVKPAWDDGDYVEVSRYVPYTEDELAAMTQRAAEAAKARQMSDATLVLVRRAAPAMADSDVLALSALFPDWAVGESYSTGDVVRHGGGLWRALQDSVGREQYPPDSFVAGWKRVGEPEGGAFPWSQPLGATDAYMKGDRVTHGGRTWVSTVDSNVWEPGVYGWEEAAA